MIPQEHPIEKCKFPKSVHAGELWMCTHCLTLYVYVSFQGWHPMKLDFELKGMED